MDWRDDETECAAPAPVGRPRAAANAAAGAVLGRVWIHALAVGAAAWALLEEALEELSEEPAARGGGGAAESLEDRRCGSCPSSGRTPG